MQMMAVVAPPPTPQPSRVEIVRDIPQDGWEIVLLWVTGIGTLGAAVAAAFAVIVSQRAAEKARQVAETQVGVARADLERAQAEAAERTREATEARETAERTLRESVKSRLDALAPRVSVYLDEELAFRRPTDPADQYRDWEELDAEEGMYEKNIRVRVTLNFVIVNHWDLAVELEIPKNPLLGARLPDGIPGGGVGGSTVILPQKEVVAAYYWETTLTDWENFASLPISQEWGDPEDRRFVVFTFVVSGPIGNVKDTHIWRGQILPMGQKKDELGRPTYWRSLRIGPAVAKVERKYVDLDED